MELKTLKEMRKIWFESDEDVNSVCGDMTINWITDGRKLLDEEQLKQEAIKDIKELREGILKLSYNIQCAGGQPLNSNVVDYIKWKFDITEEDLK